MAGLYIHIPFCKSSCAYCDFYKTTKIADKQVFLDALLIEIRKNSLLFSNELIRTIYFGGGTPSVLQRNDFELIFNTLSEFISLDRVDEITVEINPDDFTEEWATSLFNLPVNRLSFGIQSIYDDLLLNMGRRHSFKQALDSIYLANRLGFENITVDLIYGLPGLTDIMWQQTLDLICSLPIVHISAYHLTFEKNTRFYNSLKKGLISEMSDDESLLQYNMLRTTLLKNGFIDYEISNFSKSGFNSQHNSLYWSGESYYGLGPSAHSYYNGMRYWNISNLTKYTNALLNDSSYCEKEILSEIDQFNELIMLGLRQRKGFLLSRIDSFSESIRLSFNNSLNRFLSSGNIEIVDGYCRVTLNSLFITDYLIQEFFVVD